MMSARMLMSAESWSFQSRSTRQGQTLFPQDDSLPDAQPAPSDQSDTTTPEPEDTVRISGNLITRRTSSTGLSFSLSGAYRPARSGFGATAAGTASNASSVLRQSASDFVTRTDARSLPKSPDSGSDAEEWLKQLDPAMYKRFLTLMALLQKNNPENAKRLSETLKNIFATFNPAGATQAMLPTQQATPTQTNVTVSEEWTLVRIEEIRTDASGKAITGEVTVSFQLQQINLADPLVLDMNGDGINLRSTEEGVLFDINGDGVKNRTAFIQGDDAFLYLDENGNELADDAHELFGDAAGDAHGFAKLARHDDNGDGKIDASDSVYARLRLWQDRDGNGQCSHGETMSIAEAGVTSLSLGYEDMALDDGAGNALTQAGVASFADGARRVMADVLLQYETSPA